MSPQLQSYYQAAGKKWDLLWQFLAKQGYKESGWNPTIMARNDDGGTGIAQFTGATGYAYLGCPGWQQERSLSRSRATSPCTSSGRTGCSRP